MSGERTDRLGKLRELMNGGIEDPTEDAAAAPEGSKPGTDATAAGHSGSTATGPASEAGTVK